MVINLRYLEIQLNREPYRILFKFRKNPVWYRNDYKKFLRLLGNDKAFLISDNMPCVDDKGKAAGQLNPHYFLQDLYVAQLIYKKKPLKHVDVGSRIDGFVAHLASFREVELFDIRKVDSFISNVKFKQADLMDESTIPHGYCDSISSLHALEHFGLGRYGDKLDPGGHIKGFQNITKILKPQGTFYFSVPMGKQRIDFNAHRVFSMAYLLDWVQKDYDIISFAYISDEGQLHTEVNLSDEKDVDIKNSFGCHFGCAIFELKKH